MQGASVRKWGARAQQQIELGKDTSFDTKNSPPTLSLRGEGVCYGIRKWLLN